MASTHQTEPDTRPGLSADWLKKVLESYHVSKSPQQDPQVEVVGWDEERPGEKQGQMSDPVAVVVRYRSRGEDAQQHLFCKPTTQDPNLKDILLTQNLDKREVKFYTVLKPALDALERQHLGAARDSHWAPELFFAESVEGGGYTLVLENLAPKGFVVEDFKSGLDANMTKKMLTTLANFHAASVALEIKDKSLAEKMMPHVWETEKIVELYATNLKSNLNVILNVLKSQDNCQETCEAFQRFMKVDTTQVFKNAMNTSAKFNTFIHFDFWCNNIMVNRTSGDVRIIDWQTMTYGSPAIDVATLLWSSVAPEVRRKYGPQLKDHYWQALTTRLAQLGVQDLDYTREDFLQDFVRADIVPCLVIIAFISDTSTMPGSNERCVQFMIDLFKNDFWNQMT